MSQDEVDVFECLNSLLRNITRVFDADNLDCETLEDEISTLIQSSIFFSTRQKDTRLCRISFKLTSGTSLEFIFRVSLTASTFRVDLIYSIVGL